MIPMFKERISFLIAESFRIRNADGPLSRSEMFPPPSCFLLQPQETLDRGGQVAVRDACIPWSFTSSPKHKTYSLGEDGPLLQSRETSTKPSQVLQGGRGTKQFPIYY